MGKIFPYLIIGLEPCKIDLIDKAKRHSDPTNSKAVFECYLTLRFHENGSTLNKIFSSFGHNSRFYCVAMSPSPKLCL